MERKLALWLGLPFIALAGAFIVINLIAPGLIRGALFTVLILGLAISGITLTLIHAVVQMRSGESPLVALSSIAIIVIASGVSFHKQIYVMGLGLLHYASMDTFERGEGVRLGLGDDGRYHPRITIDGKMVDFVVDTAVADIVLTAEDARRIGVDPSTLRFDEEIKTAGGAQQAALIRLDRLQIGSILIEDVPAKVTAGNMSGNVLGMAFFDRLSEWEVRNDTLMIVQ